MRIGLLVFILLSSFGVKAQQLLFVSVLNQQTLVPGSTAINQLGQEYNIETVRFYISQVQFKTGDKISWQDQLPAHLIDIEKPESFLINTTGAPDKADSLVFYLGIDSAGNVADKFVGDLDPLKGMYWTWQSGYINCKIEVTSTHFSGHNNVLEWHVGGYLGNQATLQRISLPIKTTAATVHFELAPLFEPTDLRVLKSIMIPGKEAVVLSVKLAALFRL